MAESSPQSVYDVATARRELLRYARKIADRLLVVGPGGNTSARAGENVIVVKASGCAFEDCTEGDFIPIDMTTGEVMGSERKPTCEIHMHLACYARRPDIHAVIHTHPPTATGVASTGQSLPPLFPDLVALVGAEIPVLPYIVPAGMKLANAVAPLIEDHDAVLLGNHGVLTVGSNLREAYFRNLIIEEAAKTWLAAKAAGSPYILSAAQVDEVFHLQAEDYRRALLRGEIA
ncbi:MAG: class II aldolase/adducin family protein [Planctomycetota bacterium]